MGKLYNDHYKYKDNFKTTEAISSIAIFEANLDFTPKFTIAIPTYKRADLLKEAVDSALNQNDFTDYDVIVVDNNPERNCETEMLMHSYSNARLSYYKNSENIGFCGNWNRLYTLAKGEWVVMLHDDDLLTPHFIKTLNLIQESIPGYNLYVPKNNPFYTDKLHSKDKIINESKTIEYKTITKQDFYFGNAVGEPVGISVKRSVFLDLKGFDLEFSPPVDYEFFMRAAAQTKVCKITNNPIAYYRILCNESLNNKTMREMAVQIKRIKILALKDFSILKKLLYITAIDKYTYIWLHDYKNHFKVENFNIEVFSKSINLKVSVFSKIAYRIIRRLNRNKTNPVKTIELI